MMQEIGFKKPGTLLPYPPGEMIKSLEQRPVLAIEKFHRRYMRADNRSHSMNPSASVVFTAEVSCGTHSTTLAPTDLAFHEVLAYKIHGVASISQVLSTNPKLSQPVVIIVEHTCRTYV